MADQLEDRIAALLSDGLNVAGMRTFIQYAVDTCMRGRAEHDHLSEDNRQAIYTRVVHAIGKELRERPNVFLQDDGILMRQMFEHAVYGDNISGLNDVRRHTVHGNNFHGY